MKTNTVNDCPKFEPAIEGYNLTQMNVKDCLGCFSYWKKTPGKCIFHDLDSFYHDYISADIVVFFVPVTKGFISGRLKTLFDRMIPLFYLTLAGKLVSLCTLQDMKGIQM